MSATTAATVIAIKMRRYKEAFRAARATTPGTAIRPADAGLRESLIFQKLVRQRVLVETRDRRFYLDETRAAELMRLRRKLLAVILLIVVAGIIISAVATWKP